MIKKWSGYYIFYAISILLSVVLLYVLVKNLSGTEYTDYLIFINFLAVLTLTSFGVQDYYRIKFKSDVTYTSLRKYYNFIYSIQLIIVILALLIFSSFGTTSYIIIMLLLTMLPNNMILAYKHVFLLIGDNSIFNFVDVAQRLLTIIMIVLLKPNLESLLIILLVSRIVVLLFIEIYLFVRLKDLRDTVEVLEIDKFATLKSGLMYIFGFWLIMNVYNVDLFIAGFSTGASETYGFVKTIASLAIVILSPLRNIFFISIDYDTQSYINIKIIYRLMISVFLIVSVIYVFINLTGHLWGISGNNYVYLYLLSLVFYLPVTLYIINVMISDQRLLIKNAIIYAMIFTGMISLTVGIQGINTSSLIIGQFVACVFSTLFLIYKYTERK